LRQNPQITISFESCIHSHHNVQFLKKILFEDKMGPLFCPAPKEEEEGPAHVLYKK